MSLLGNLKAKLTGAPSVNDLINDVPEHMDRYVGITDWVFHEIVSDRVHIDVHVIPATSTQPFNVIFTTGMSMREMKGRARRGVPRLAELMVYLPGSWDLKHERFDDESVYWPVRHLKKLARVPHDMGITIGEAVSVPFDDPPVPAPGTNFGGFMLVKPSFLPPAGQVVTLKSGLQVQLYCLMPLTMEEMDWKAKQPHGRALLELIQSRNIPLMDLLVADPNRASVV